MTSAISSVKLGQARGKQRTDEQVVRVVQEADKENRQKPVLPPIPKTSGSGPEGRTTNCEAKRRPTFLGLENTTGSNNGDVEEPGGNQQPPLTPIYSPTKLTALALTDYQKVCTIGKGSFGKVIVCREQGTDEYFALKVMSIQDLIESGQVQHAKSERRCLEMTLHPFIVQFYWAYRDESFLYMLLEYAPGGDLFTQLRRQGRFSDETTRFYAAEIVLALEYLHSWFIAHRDLKPENVLLDRAGHIKLADFGFAKRVKCERTYTLCGTAQYLAPEIIQRMGHDTAVDWWSLGILIFELTTGKPPFRGEDNSETYDLILEGRIRFPDDYEYNAKEIVQGLLEADITKRLGCTEVGSSEVKCHAWFREHVNWTSLAERRIMPPIRPKVAFREDGTPIGKSHFFNDCEAEFTEATPSQIDAFADW